ncbi:nuclear transport factor 2 family protein [Vibrio nitrifigilis]|uniref:Nuclear transport factor 2 family protein n=1 Tax=Vibrio nitrifigilis TaxID=2789781 RepID=A0ABS0GEK4_9VIBR|nr:nuclear transport factor 2 family protein [Vibrio nitrifigilis]MBF9000807.1 nuclear transport factor 2 family protein [Vibrio nitrifigilis]
MDVQSVAEFYQQLGKSNLNTLSQIYHPDIVFEDAAHQINGLSSLEHYFEQLYLNVTGCRFTIHEAHQTGNGGFLVWTMALEHPKLKGGATISVKGISQIRFEHDKVIYHRDYFDLGEMVYENVPCVGAIIRTIKQRLGQ